MPSLLEMVVLLGVFLPIVGLAATFLLAWSFEGVRHWTILAVGPALTLLVLVVFFDPISKMGHMLAVAMLLGLVVFLIFYYPILAIVGLIAWRRSR